MDSAGSGPRHASASKTFAPMLFGIARGMALKIDIDTPMVRSFKNTRSCESGSRKNEDDGGAT